MLQEEKGSLRLDAGELLETLASLEMPRQFHVYMSRHIGLAGVSAPRATWRASRRSVF